MFGVYVILASIVFVKTEVFVVKENTEKTPVTYFPDLAMQFYNGERIVSEKCLNQSRLLFRDLQNLTFWASEMWDASAKQPSGFLYGSTYQLGNFDECVHPTWDRNFRPHDVNTQYCLADIYIHIKPNRVVSKYKPKYDPYASILDKVWYTGDKSRLRRDLLYWALCVPASCSFNDVEALLNGYLNFTNSMSLASTEPGHPTLAYEASLDKKSCQVQTEDIELSDGAILFFWFVGMLLLLSISSTVLHYYFRLRNKKNEAEDFDEKVPEAVKIFSLIRQISKLLYNPDDQVEVLSGIRFFSICLIILDHRVGTMVSGPISNMQYVEQTYGKFVSLFMTRGDMLVDSFFALSGLVFCYSILKFYKEKGRISIPLAIMDRYIRLAPVFAFCMFFVSTVYDYSGDGPQWNKVVGRESGSCRQTWWLGLLMLGNYVNDDQICLVHSWYIPCDFHFFLFALIGFVLLKGRKKAAFSTLAFAGIVAILIPAGITLYYRLPALLHFYTDFLTSPRTHVVMKTIYTKSHNRAGAYVIGIIAGCIIYKYRRPGNENKLSVILATLGSVIGLAVMFAAVASGTIYYDVTRPYNALEAALYAGVIRPIWAFGLCLFILSCVFGNVPVLTQFLSCAPFAVLSKLVYGMYLTHMILQLRQLGQVRQPMFFEGMSIIQLACGDVLVSGIISFFLYIFVESPSRDLIRFLRTCCMRKRRVEPETTTTTPNLANDNRPDPESNAVTMNSLRMSNYIKNINVSKDTINEKMV